MSPEIDSGNDDPFVPSTEWQQLKPGQSVPRGMHVRLNMATGGREARLLDDHLDDVRTSFGLDTTAGSQKGKVKETGMSDPSTLDEWKKAVKSIKNSQYNDTDMQTLKREKKFRNYEELKAELGSLFIDIKTDSEMVVELVEQLKMASPAVEDVLYILDALENLLHQFDNAVLFSELDGALATLLSCFNSSADQVRVQAGLTLGSALQSNPKVQIVALENGSLHVMLRVLSTDSSLLVRKRAMFALSSMVRQFPFAQRRLVELGGLSVLAGLFSVDSTGSLPVKAITLLTDLIQEMKTHREMSDTTDLYYEEKLRQYRFAAVEEHMVKTGWCSLVPQLLGSADGHDSVEKVLSAMSILLDMCLAHFLPAVPVLRQLAQQYEQLDRQLAQQYEGSSAEDTFFFTLSDACRRLANQISSPKDEL